MSLLGENLALCHDYGQGVLTLIPNSAAPANSGIILVVSVLVFALVFL